MREAERCDVSMGQRSGGDICACGDRRDQHRNGTGACNLGELCTPTRCQRFRLFQTKAEHGVSEADYQQRLQEQRDRRNNG